MIELTVRTLDSQNHQFTVEDDITVEQFKAKIADTVNIPADTQRIIYCGRVLQDSSKLADYDVNGKVVHLVQRPPPGTTPRSNSRSSSPQPQRRVYRPYRMEQGNAMYLGSMAFPGNLMESQGIVPPPPTHSLSGSRLNVAKRMLRRAGAVIRLLENPSAGPAEQNNAEENQDEEVTPVIEARVIVPNNTEPPIDEVLSVVQNTLLGTARETMALEDSNVGTSTAVSEPVEDSNVGTSSAVNQVSAENVQTSANQSETSTPGIPTPRSSSAENLASEGLNPDLPENAFSTAEMASLLSMLGHLQTRFSPFLERYHDFMIEDPEVPHTDHRQMQTMLNRVSEVLHYLGHAYHSLSDIIVGVCSPPPRALLCRPILIQHSAVVQTGIPIQVEVAQINLSADRVPAGASTTQTRNAQTTDTSTSSTTSNTTSATTSATSSTSGNPSILVQPLQSGFMNLPLLPTVRVQSFPVEVPVQVHTVRANRPQNNNNNTVNQATAATTTPSESNAGGNSAQAQEGQSGQRNNFNFNNPNVEFFMEVTPEGITIDSLETTLVDSNQANDFLRGALNVPPPEFLQSLMQMAGQIITRNIATTATSTVASTTSSTSTDQSQSTAASQQQQNAQPIIAQNSQARGNTQTNPTTATSTRSTPRPHVHLAQQAMQGGFDPFLPCNSHHISTSRRRMQLQAQQQNTTSNVATNTSSNSQQTTNTPPVTATTRESQQQTPQQQQQQQQQPTAVPQGPPVPEQLPNVGNIFGVLVDSIDHLRRNRSQTGGSSSSAPSRSTAGGDGVRVGLNAGSPLVTLLSNVQETRNFAEMLLGPLEQVLHLFLQDENYVPGESIIIDLIMIFVRNLTLIDLVSLTNGETEPINGNITEIQNFFRTRVCDQNVSPSGIDAGVERLITEVNPFLENFSSLTVRDNIDMVRSAQQLFRQRLPEIITTSLNLTPETVRTLFDQCVTMAKQLLALTLLASSNGQQGVEQIYEQIMNHFMQDVSPDIQNWTLMLSRVRLRQALSNLNIHESILRPYIVLRQENVPVVASSRSNGVTQEVEAMELDVLEAPREELAPPSGALEDTEPLPDIVLGSESWHNQVPEDWVPIITRDAQKQRRQNSQGPFSDAYLSGMPSKRRKIINNSKPQGSLPRVITEGVRQAVVASGLASAAPLDTVAQLAGTSPEIQNTYRNLFRSTVQANLRENEDFTPERFPNATKYFNLQR